MDINEQLKRNIRGGRFGASLGRCSTRGVPPIQPVWLQLVRLDSGGYDRGGAYWGSCSHWRVYCAMNENPQFQFFIWARDRLEAKALIENQVPDIEWMS